MTRIARVVAPGVPHHVTQRGTAGNKLFSATMIIELIWSLWPSGVHAAPRLERALSRRLRKQKPGPKPNRRSR